MWVFTSINDDMLGVVRPLEPKLSSLTDLSSTRSRSVQCVPTLTVRAVINYTVTGRNVQSKHSVKRSK